MSTLSQPVRITDDFADAVKTTLINQPEPCRYEVFPALLPVETPQGPTMSPAVMVVIEVSNAILGQPPISQGTTLGFNTPREMIAAATRELLDHVLGIRSRLLSETNGKAQ